MKIKKTIQPAFQKIHSLIMKTKAHTITTREVLSNSQGASALEIALASIIAVVLGILILNAFTGIFNTTIIPKVTSSITGMFS